MQLHAQIPDIYTLQEAVEKICAYHLDIDNIIAYPPDYILRFETSREWAIVERHKILNVSTFAFTLERWSAEYRASIKTWLNTKVTIDILGIPPHAVLKKVVASVLAQYCHTETCQYDPKTGICRVNGLAYAHDAIPSVGKFPVEEHTKQGTRTYICCITMRTYLDGHAPSLANNARASSS